ncbi:MAG: pyruvate ferredoxin oxidoreductase [Deltaproteobacteria bacterium]|nr:pyruvate ferredoxin oxidoreductase [Deltaproteobacteria bacterium]
MAVRKGIESSLAIAEAAAACNVDCIAAYPITPQTHIVEHLSELVNDGVLDAEFIPVESEHSAMSCCCGTAAAGARTFTATSSQGLALMHEIMFIAANLRLPIVMTVANRALSAPINIWNDHSDVMTERDCGWLQIFGENGQESTDLVPICHKIAEDKRVLLPIMLNFDGFIVSHVVEPIEMLTREEIATFLPDYEPQQRLDVDNPITMGPVGMPEVYTEAKMAHEAAVRNAYGPICEILEEFGQKFGRTYKPVETYKTEDADIVFVMMGAASETCMSWVDKVREQGKKVGIVRFRLWRPLPVEAFKEAVQGKKVLGIIDRHFSPGGAGGPVAQEVKYTLYGEKDAPKAVEVVAGLGGRDIDFDTFDKIFDRCQKVLDGGEVPPFELIQARGGHYGKI